MSLKQRTPDELNNATRDVINAFAVKGKYKLIGSNSLRSIQYGSDYDVESILKGISPEKIAKMFQDEYKRAEADPNIWIIDFKCGHNPALVYTGDYSTPSLNKYLKNPSIPKDRVNKIKRAKGEEQIELVRDLFILRWKPDDIKRGFIKMVDGNTRTLTECILDKTIMKIDLVVKVGNQFAEISENYYITINGKSNFSKIPTEKELKAGLEEDIRYYSHSNSLKALKRLFSILLLDGKKKNKAKVDSLISFFNGQVGYLNKIKSELEILESVLTSDFRKPKWADVVANLQFIKEQISQIYEIPLNDNVFEMIDKIKEKTALKTIVELKDYFQTKINNISKDFLKHYI